MFKYSFIIIIFLFLFIDTGLTQYYKISGRMEMYYDSYSSQNKSGDVIYSKSALTKLLSLRYPVFIIDPNFISINPSMRFFDSDLTLINRIGYSSKTREVKKNFKDFDYKVSTKMFSLKAFPFTSYYSKQRRTGNNDDLFSNGDYQRDAYGLNWTLRLNQLIYKYLPKFGFKYDNQDRYKGELANGDRRNSGFNEKIGISLQRTFNGYADVGYNYSTFEDERLYYDLDSSSPDTPNIKENLWQKSHRMTHDTYHDLTDMLEMEVHGNYEMKNEKNHFQDVLLSNNDSDHYFLNSFLRFRPNKEFFSYLNHNLRINENKYSYSRVNTINLNNQYRHYFIGGSRDKENLLFTGNLNYSFQHSYLGKDNPITRTRNSIYTRGLTVYEKALNGIFIKPGYQLGLNYSGDSEDNSAFSHAHKFIVGADNRGNRFVTGTPQIYYEIKLSEANTVENTSQAIGYGHYFRSSYFGKLSLGTPLEYNYRTDSSETVWSDFNTQLKTGYHILRFFQVKAWIGYIYNSVTTLLTENYNTSIHANQGIYFNRYGVNASFNVSESQRNNQDNKKDNGVSIQLIAKYRLGRFSAIMDYKQRYGEFENSTLFNLRMTRSI